MTKNKCSSQKKKNLIKRYPDDFIKGSQTGESKVQEVNINLQVEGPKEGKQGSVSEDLDKRGYDSLSIKGRICTTTENDFSSLIRKLFQNYKEDGDLIPEERISVPQINETSCGTFHRLYTDYL